jgi:hypothetical protein
MGDIPLWPFFLPNEHPNRPGANNLSTREAQNDYAVKIILPLIQTYISSIRRNTSNGLRRYVSLQGPVNDWLSVWASDVDVKEFWKSPMGYKPPSYGTGVPGASPYPSAPPPPPSYTSARLSYTGAPPAPPLTLRNATPSGPYIKEAYRGGPVRGGPVRGGPVRGGPSLPDALTIRAAVHGMNVTAGVAAHGVAKLGDALAGVPAVDCVGGCDLPDCGGCQVVGGRRKKKRKTIRRRHSKKRTRKTRRV